MIITKEKFIEMSNGAREVYLNRSISALTGSSRGALQVFELEDDSIIEKVVNNMYFVEFRHYTKQQQLDLEEHHSKWNQNDGSRWRKG